LAGRQHGYENCEILFTRFVKVDRPRNTAGEGIDRLIFVCAGELAVQSGSQQITVGERTLERLPRGLSHTLWNASSAEALCLEITTSGARPVPMSIGATVDLSSLAVRFEGHGPVDKSSGFDYQFLANRNMGSAHVALNIARVMPGHRGPDFHIHKFDQFYFVLGGRLSVEVGFDQFEVEPFTLVALPAGIIHRQGNGGKTPEEHLAIISPEPQPGEPLDYQIAMPSPQS